jgi:class 3 adenylate cyclase
MAPRVERKLAAILATDVVGYSRLVAADEAGTIGRLKALRTELIEPVIGEHHGRVVKLMGDGMLVEFASAVDAVGCAVAIQKGRPPSVRLLFQTTSGSRWPRPPARGIAEVVSASPDAMAKNTG